MQKIVDCDYYFKEHNGIIPTPSLVEEYILLAICDVHRLTFNRINSKGFDNLESEQQALIKKACCYQADYLYKKLNNDAEDDNIASYSAGNVSVTYDTARKSRAEIEKVSEQSYRLLKLTGLMQRVI